MPVRAITVTNDYVEIERSIGDVLHFDFADFPPSASTNLKRQQLVTENVQSWLDDRQLLSTFPADDPIITGGDPGQPYMFYDGSGANQAIVYRFIVIEDVVYDSAQTPPLRFTLRRLWP